MKDVAIENCPGPHGVAADLDDRGENEPREECGVFGVWAPGEEVAKLTYFGLFALQHRGQEAAGIATGDGDRIVVYKDMGLVSQVFDESLLSAFEGSVAIGHTRYSTAGGKDWSNVQPMFRSTRDGLDIALGHNGNLVNYVQLRDEAVSKGLIDREDASDTTVLTALLADGVHGETGIFEAARELLPRVTGAFCLTFTDGKTLYAARDPQGVRPLALGRLERGWVIASETCALDIVGASFVREIEPGELVAVDNTGIRSESFARPRPRGCVFEYVYLARPDSVIRNRPVNAARIEIGRRLARLSRSHQVIVVTHLPQVAAYADTHLHVEKATADSSEVTTLTGERRVAELARMLAGLADTDTGRAHAAELLERAQAEVAAMGD